MRTTRAPHKLGHRLYVDLSFDLVINGAGSVIGSVAVGRECHRELDAHWRRVRVALERVVAGDGVSLPASDVEALVGLYEQHIECEERDLLPMAARLLSDAALERIGRAMRERRGIEPVT